MSNIQFILSLFSHNILASAKLQPFSWLLTIIAISFRLVTGSCLETQARVVKPQIPTAKGANHHSYWE